MGDLLQFPKGEPEGEAPQVGYCMQCGEQVAWPNDGSAWPESCPYGCTPFHVQSWPREPNVFRWGQAQGPPPCS